MSLPLSVLIGLGAALGVVFVAVFGRWAGGSQEDAVYATTLVAAAFVYLLFAVVEGEPQQLAVESGGFVLFALLALRALRRRAPGVLALGWLLHAAWDAGVHLLLEPGLAPAAYPPLCLGFDLAVAFYLILRIATLLADPDDA